MDWEQRLSELWASFDDQDEEQFLSRMEQLVGELPADNAVGIFERAGSLDSTGHSDLAVPLWTTPSALPSLLLWSTWGASGKPSRSPWRRCLGT